MKCAHPSVGMKRPTRRADVRRILSRRVYVGKNLTRLGALALAKRKRPGDYRAFAYDPATGWAVLT